MPPRKPKTDTVPDPDESTEEGILALLLESMRDGDSDRADTLAPKVFISTAGLRVLTTLVTEHDEFEAVAVDVDQFRADWKAAGECLDRLNRIRPATVEQSSELASQVEEGRDLLRKSHNRLLGAESAAIKARYLRSWAAPLFGDCGRGSVSGGGLLAETRTYAVAMEVAGIEPGESRPLTFGWRGPQANSTGQRRPVRKIVSAMNQNQGAKS